jgi:membrane protein YdbS with pleckstrin-like domain
MKQRHQQKLVIISLVLLIALNLPILLLFDSADSLLGFPVIYIYIFSVWLFSTLLSLLIIKRYHE